MDTDYEMFSAVEVETLKKAHNAQWGTIFAFGGQQVYGDRSKPIPIEPYASMIERGWMEQAVIDEMGMWGYRITPKGRLIAGLLA